MPDIVQVAVLDEAQAAVMLDPGANRSRHGPTFEKDDTRSRLVVEPTVIASGAEAGDREHASVAELPEETMQLTPF